MLFLSLSVKSANLPSVRVGEHPGFTRVVLDLPKDASYQIDALGVALRISLPGTTLEPGINFVSRPELVGYVLEQHPDKAVLILLTPQGVTPNSGFKAQVLAATEGEGLRLVIDLSGGFVNTSPFTPFPFAFAKGNNRRFSVLLDPGHGGVYPGAKGEVLEKTVNLQIALKVRELLQSSGVDVSMTREGDTNFSSTLRTDLDQRARMADGKTLFVSLHSNAIDASRINGWAGLEVYYFDPKPTRIFYPPSLDPSPNPVVALPPPPLPSADLTPPDTLEPGSNPSTQEPIGPQPLPTPTPQMDSSQRASFSRMLATRVMGYMLGTTGATNRGVRSEDFYVIRYTTVPAILVEMGYVTHPLEGQALSNENYQNRLAYGIARGILEYLENDAQP